LLGLCAPVARALPVFPGAAGYGTQTVAGRGPGGVTPTIYVVDKLTDSATPVLGELRHGVENTTGPRIIVFEVAGVIELKKVIRIRKDRPYITIAGQTAPPPGITLKNAGFDIQTHDVLIQHLAIRPGAQRNDQTGWTGLPGFGNRKAVLINPVSDVGQSVYNVVFDHVSVSWGTDENFTISGDNNPTYDITFSNSFNYEALRFCGKLGSPASGGYIGHPDVYTTDGSGSIIKRTNLNPRDGHSAGMYVYKGAQDVSVAKNVFAFNRWRNPLVAGLNSANTGYAVASARDVRIVNNLVYAPGESSGHRMDIGAQSPANTGTTTVSADGNVVILHPDPTSFPVFAAVEGIATHTSSTATQVFRTEPSGPNIINLYLNNNRLYHPASGWVTATPPYNTTIFSEGRAVNPVGETLSDGVPLFSSGLTGTQVRDELLAKSGSRPLVRDLHDRRLVAQIKDAHIRDWTDFPNQSLVQPGFNNYIDTTELDGSGYPLATGFHELDSLAQLATPLADSNSNGWLDVEEWIHAWSKFVEAVPSGTLSPETPRLDNFEAATFSGWTTSGGSWSRTTVGAADTPEENQVYQQTNSATTARALMNDTNWAYQTVQAEMKTVTLGATYAFGVLGRYRDASNHYHLVLRTGGVFELRRVVGGTTTVLASSSGYSVSTGGTYRFRLVLDGPQLVGTVSTWNGTTFTWGTPAQIVGFDYNPIANGSAGLGTSNAATQSNCVLASPSIEERDLFAEDFQAGTSHWTNAATSSWSVVSDGGSLVYRQTNTSLGAATFNDVVAGDQTIETALRFLSVADNADRWIGLMARYTNESNYYYTALRYSGSGNANNRIEVKKLVGGTPTELDRAYLSVSVPATYQMRLEVVGPTLNVYLGQRRVLETHDPALTQGRQGVRMYKASAQFDDFTVTRHKN
jgi:hypothetical protein